MQLQGRDGFKALAKVSRPPSETFRLGVAGEVKEGVQGAAGFGRTAWIGSDGAPSERRKLGFTEFFVIGSRELFAWAGFES
jgi:hypothetical protein